MTQKLFEMEATLRNTVERARARALLPYPWEMGPMAAIFGDNSLSLPWLDPLQYQHSVEDEAQVEDQEKIPGALPVVTFSAGSRGEGLGPEEEDRHMRRASLTKWHGTLRRMGVYSSLARTIEAEEGDMFQVLDDVFASV